MFNTLFCRHSSAFDRATVTWNDKEWADVMQVWTLTYYAAETNTLDGRDAPPPHTQPHILSAPLYPCAFGSRLGPLQTQILDPAHG